MIGRRLLAAATATLLALGLASGATPVQAAPQAGFWGYDNNLVVADSVMDDYGSMTAAQIQTFLEQQGAPCVRGSDGSPCLKNATFTTTSKAATAFCPSAYVGASGEKASTIIHKVAQACRINPQLLLTFLQKEQSLVNTTNPSAIRYQKAMGFGCPDGQPCKPQYAGFQNQVYSAASRFHQYRQEPSNFSYRVGGTYDVKHNPNSACGTTRVHMDSAATAAVYNYTPFVPNAAALANPAGSGDSCSSYDKLNVFRIFSNWFGAPNISRRPVTAPINRDLLGLGYPAVVVNTSSSARLWSPRLPVTSRFSTPTRLGTGFTARTLAPGDWTGDGIPDVLLIDNRGTMWLYPRTAAGGFSPRSAIGHGWQIMDRVLAGTDWNGDRRPDLIARRADTGELFLYSGNGTGGFTARTRIGVGWKSMTTLALSDRSVQGRPAIQAVDGSGRLHTYPANGTGGFSPRIVQGLGWASMVHLTGVGDWNLDGVGDLVAVTPRGDLMLYPGVRTGQFGSGRRIGGGWATWRAVMVADRRANNSVLWGVNATGSLMQYRYSAVRVARAIGVSIPAGADVFPAGDWNGDGRPDLMYRVSTGTLFLVPGTGPGTYGAPQQIGRGWHQFSQVVAIRSWRGDGRPGLATLSSTGEVRVYPANSAGVFQGWYIRVGSWSGTRGIFAAGASTPGRQVSIGLLGTDGTARIVRRNTTGTPTGTVVLATGWSSHRTVVGGFDIDRTVNTELLLARSDGAIVYRGPTGRLSTWAPVGTVSGTVR